MMQRMHARRVAGLVVAGALFASVAVSLASAQAASPKPPVVTKVVACQGKGSCDVASASPQILCLSTPCNIPGGTTVAKISVTAYKNGHTAAGVHVRITLLTTGGSKCSAASGLVHSGVTNAQGIYSINYSDAPPTSVTAAFCLYRAQIGAKVSTVGAVDQTNDPAPWKVVGTPAHHLTFDVISARVKVHLQVTNPAASPSYVNGDPTTFFSEVPSVPGACGAWSPLTVLTGPHDRNGRATLKYIPSTVGGPAPKVSCTLRGQEADTGIISNKIVIFQRKP